MVEWASLLAVSVWAYGDGGASAVGLVGLLRMLPAAVALPFGAAVADRFPRHRVLVVAYVAQALLLAGVAAVIHSGGPAALTYLLIAVVGVVAAPCRPAQLALAPMLARSPEELVAANVTQMTFEGLATLLGPALAGVVLALSGPPAALGVAAGFSLASALLLRAFERLPTRLSPPGGTASPFSTRWAAASASWPACPISPRSSVGSGCRLSSAACSTCSSSR